MRTGQGLPGRMQPLSFGRTSKTSSDIFNSFRSAQIADALVSKVQPSTIYEFQLGNELLTYTSPFTENYSGNRPLNSDCYLIFEGRVRLLCQNIHLQRQISADLLQAGTVLGADHLFNSSPLSYRAVATIPCQIIQIPYEQLIIQLEQFPQLHKYLNLTTQQRERLIFFKQFTQQYSISYRTLKYVILPQLIEQRVNAGEYLFESLSTAGYFWLRAGQILSQSNPAASPSIGTGWGYPETIPEDWIAQTDLTIYKLPLDAWKTLDLLHF